MACFSSCVFEPFKALTEIERSWLSGKEFSFLIRSKELGFQNIACRINRLAGARFLIYSFAESVGKD